MSAFDTTKSLLPSQGFRMVLKRAPHLVYWVQKAPIPGMELGVVTVPDPLNNYPLPGEHMRFDDFEVIFKVDEDLANYLEIHFWMKGLGKPDSYEQYKDLLAGPDGPTSDVTVLIDDARRNAHFEVVFRDAFPSSLSGLNLDATTPEVEYVGAAVRFSYTDYVINLI